MDTGQNVESTRSMCFELAAAAYSNNQLDLERYESLAGKIAEATGLNELEEIRESLPAIVEPPPEKAQLVTAQSSNLKRSGRWLTSGHVDIQCKSSNIVLDFTEYSSERDLRVELKLDCRSSNLRIIVPQNIDVIESIESNRASVFRDRRRPSDTNSAVVVTGTVTSTRIKVKRKRVQ